MTTDIKELVKRLRDGFITMECEDDVVRYTNHAAADALEAMAGEVASLQNTFDLMWKADQRAIKLWQEATGKDHIWPDRTKTTLWLLERLEAAEAERDRLKAAASLFVNAYTKAHPMRTADFHSPGCVCIRCAFDATRKALGGDAS